MEYRKRRRTAYRASLSDGNVTQYVAIALFLAIAGLIGFSKPSTWIARELLAPVFSGGRTAENPEENGMPVNGAAVVPIGVKTETRECILPAYACYMLQIGIYESEENALSQSAVLNRLGAAGRVWEDNGRYRVLASGYTKQADAKAVQQQLLTAGVESYVYPVQCAERAYRVAGESDEADTFCKALEGIPIVLQTLYENMIAFDKNGLNAGEGLLAAKSVAEQCDTQYEALTALAQDNNGEAKALLAFYKDVSAKAAEVGALPQTDAKAITAAIKALYLHAVACRLLLNA